MSPTTLTRLSGLALMLAAALSLAGGALHPVIEGESHGAAALARSGFAVAHVLLYSGGIALLLGLPGLYARIAPRAGVLGLAGFALSFVTTATLATFLPAYEAFVASVLAADPATRDLVAPGGVVPSSTPFVLLQGVGGPLYMLGLVLLGSAVFRSRLLPRWAGALLAAAPIFLLLPVPETPLLTGLLIELPRGLAFAAMGYALVATGTPAPAGAATRTVRPAPEAPAAARA
jgi:hypothetical protein